MSSDRSFTFKPRNADDIFSEFFGQGSTSMPPTKGVTINPSNADDIFSEFFGEGSTSVPSTKGATINPNDIFSEFFGEGSTSVPSAKGATINPSNANDVFSEFFGSSGGEGSARKGAAIERTLPCSLEDLYKGTTKKMKISRDVTDAFGRPTTVEEILTIEIKPGWKKGTKITFSGKGNEQRGVIPSDLVFIIDEKPHAVFKRDDNDLVATQRISLVEALTGYTAQLTTLDGRSLTVHVTSVINPTYEEVVRGEGMPIPKEPTKKGNLRVKFIIKFPTRLTAEQKTTIKRSLTA